MTFVGAGLEAWGGVCWGAARLEGPGQGLRRGLEGLVRPSQTSLDGAEEVQRGKVAILSHRPPGPSRGLWEGLGWGVGRVWGRNRQSWFSVNKRKKQTKVPLGR